MTWVHGVHDTAVFDAKPESRRHDALFGLPPVIPGPSLEVYLFTDGRATLTIRTTGLSGRTSYTPAAPLRSRVTALKSTCVPLGCSDPTGRTNGLTYGGEAFDLKGSGWAEYYAINRDDSANPTTNQLHTIAGCLIPNYAHPAEPADPAAHPYGCAATSDALTAADEAGNMALQHTLSALPSTMYGYDNFWTGGHGRQYIGFQAIGAGPSAGRAVTYGLWFRFLT